jgi:phosphoglycerate dehydrogenase-like enzyme
VVFTPHIGGVTDLSYGNMSRKLIEESWRVVGLGEKPTVRINDV